MKQQIITMSRSFCKDSFVAIIEETHIDEIFNNFIDYIKYHDGYFLSAFCYDYLKADNQTSVKQKVYDIFDYAKRGKYTSADMSYGDDIISTDDVIIDLYIYKRGEPIHLHDKTTDTLTIVVSVSKHTYSHQYTLNVTDIDELKTSLSNW